MRKEGANDRTAAYLILIYAVMTVMLLIIVWGPAREVGTQTLDKIFSDGELSPDELRFLRKLQCEDVKRMLNTEKDVCVYFTDSEGAIVDFLGDGSYGVGCPGTDARGAKVCTGKG